VIDFPEVRLSFEREGQARVKRNLAAGVYGPEVAEEAAVWLHEQEDRVTNQMMNLMLEQQALSRRAAAAAGGAAIFSFAVVILVLLDLLFRR
jgi:hypothetical protein